MDLTVITTPIIGACIGYVTNYIAVKMLFRPLKPILIGKYKLPFTPGVIPKEKERLAKGIGDIVGSHLITQEGLEKVLLSETIQEKITQFLKKQLNDSDKTLEFILDDRLSKEKTTKMKSDISSSFTTKIKDKLVEADIGCVLAAEVAKSIKENLKGGFLSMMLSDNLLQSLAKQIGDGITDYLETKGYDLLLPYVNNEMDTVCALSMKDINDYASNHDIIIEDIILTAYQKMVKEHLGQAIQLLDIQEIVKKQIDSMDVLELEHLLLSVMKKELNAVVNLGAVIGFILGLVNLFF